MLTLLSPRRPATAPGARAAAVELVHMATLVHDDVLDAAPRAARPCGGLDARTAPALRASAGDHLFALAFAGLARPRRRRRGRACWRRPRSSSPAARRCRASRRRPRDHGRGLPRALPLQDRPAVRRRLRCSEAVRWPNATASRPWSASASNGHRVPARRRPPRLRGRPDETGKIPGIDLLTVPRRCHCSSQPRTTRSCEPRSPGGRRLEGRARARRGHGSLGHAPGGGARARYERQGEPHRQAPDGSELEALADAIVRAAQPRPRQNDGSTLDRTSTVRPSTLSPIRRRSRPASASSFDDGLAILESDELLEIGELADLARRLRGGTDEVSFVQNLYLSQTNVCRVKCKFCAFAATQRQTRLLDDHGEARPGRRRAAPPRRVHRDPHGER